MARIHLATNQILAEIGHPGAGQEPVQLAFQERAGWIIVSLARRGWLDAVPADQREAFLQAVRGLYHLAGVDLVWEQVVARFGPHVNWYDVNAEGLCCGGTGGMPPPSCTGSATRRPTLPGRRRRTA